MKLKSTGLKFKNLGNPPTTIQTPAVSYRKPRRMRTIAIANNSENISSSFSLQYRNGFASRESLLLTLFLS